MYNKKWYIGVLVIFLLLLTSTPSIGLLINPNFDKKTWKNFKSDTLYVVSGYNSESLKVAMENYWSFSNYRFISPEEFKNLKNDPNKFFLYRSELTDEHVRESNIRYSKLNFLFISKGGSGIIESKKNMMGRVAMFDGSEENESFMNLYVKYLI